jgi:hypothetical protein
VPLLVSLSLLWRAPSFPRCAHAPQPVTVAAARGHLPVAARNEVAWNVPTIQQAATPSRLVGFWFPEQFGNPAGVVMRADAPMKPDEWDPMRLVKCMQEAPVVAGFRSGREAKLVAMALEGWGEGSVVWFRGEFNGNWSLCAEPPAGLDTGRHPIRTEWPIGEAVAGLRPDPLLTLFPPPLQKRGIGISTCRPKANAFPSLVPRDTWSSFFGSWDEIDRAFQAYGAEIRAWDGVHVQTTPWTERARLRR